MADNNQELTNDVRRIDIFLSSLSQLVKGSMAQTLVSQGQSIQSLLNTRANVIASPVANLLWNGEIGHSVHTWNDTDPAINLGDPNKEAVWIFSHNAPATAQTFTTITTNNQIPLPGHNFTTGCTVDFTTTTTLPTGLALATTYFVIVISSSIVSVATTIANAFSGTAVAITSGTGVGTHTIQQLLISLNDLTTTPATAVNNELKTSTHSTYNPRYCKWDSTAGQADMTGTMSVDILMPSNNVDATVALARVSLIAARRNSYIEIPEACLFGCGIWDNTSGQRKFLTGDIAFTASLVGTTGATTRKFKVLLTSDRGYSLLSSEITIANALADGVMDASNYIAMEWRQQAGQLQVDIYEHYDPGGAHDSYRLVQQVSSASTYIYEGNYILDGLSGYPTPTATVRTATFYSQTADMSDLAINDVALAWDTVNFPIGVPNNYNKANTTNRQWVRLWMTVAANLVIPDTVTTDGSATITVPTGILDVAQYGTGASSIYAGLTADVYDSSDVLLTSTTISSVTNETTIVLAATVTSGSNRKLRITAGGFHGIIIDKIHLGYQQNTSYAPNALDSRTLQPLAAPTSSGQGGVGGGGSGGGIDTCVVGDTPIKRHDGSWMPIVGETPGREWSGGKLSPNLLVKLSKSQEIVNVRKVTSANGCEIVCTDGEAFLVDDTEVGIPLYRLRVGDAVMTEIDDRFEKTTISEISPYIGKEFVYTPSLSDNHLFIAGKRIKGKRKKGGFVLHNAKPIIGPTTE